ncbi:MAG: hypothetical protein SOT35_04550 [Bullifex sp.]|nr:hypothetical protein [Bullifex sp.]
MKKFSVIFVAMLIALMLFVGCENKPKERAATAEDMIIVGNLVTYAMYLPSETPLRAGVDISPDFTTVTFDNVKIDDKNVLCGKATQTANADGTVKTLEIELTKGTMYNGVAHTLTGKLVINENDPTKNTVEIILDGYRLTDLEKVEIQPHGEK